MADSGLANFKAPKDKNSKPIYGAEGSGKVSGGTKGCLGCAGVFVALLVFAGIMGAVAGNRDDGPSATGGKYEAIAQCEARIERLLKAPSTAEFDSDATGSGAGPWDVTGVVDAENSFGAALRSSFGCTVTMSGDMATTTVDYFND